MELFVWGAASKNGDANALKPHFTYSSGKILSVSIGSSHGALVDENGHVACWGSNSCGQLGTSLPDQPRPCVIGSLALRQFKAVFIACGASHSLMLDSRGKLWAWGLNSSGQCGMAGLKPRRANRRLSDESYTTTFANYLSIRQDLSTLTLGDQCAVRAPHVVDGLSSISSDITCISAGLAHNAFVTADGRAYAFGAGGFGQLGNGSFNDSALPLPILIRSNSGVAIPTCVVASLSCGGGHTLLVSRHGQVFSAGCNCCGQLGLGAEHPQDAAVAVQVIMPEDVPAGNGEEIVATSDQYFPRASTLSHEHLADIKANVTIRNVAAGDAFSAALTSNGRVLVWGWAARGQLGLDSRLLVDQMRSPSIVNILVHDGVFGVGIAAGIGHVLLLSSTGQIISWGLSGPYSAVDLAPLDEARISSVELFRPRPILFVPRGILLACSGTMSLAVSETFYDVGDDQSCEKIAEEASQRHQTKEEEAAINARLAHSLAKEELTIRRSRLLELQRDLSNTLPKLLEAQRRVEILNNLKRALRDALESARMLESLSPAQAEELRSLRSPPLAVRIVFLAVLLLAGSEDQSHCVLDTELTRALQASAAELQDVKCRLDTKEAPTGACASVHVQQKSLTEWLTYECECAGTRVKKALFSSVCWTSLRYIVIDPNDGLMRRLSFGQHENSSQSHDAAFREMGVDLSIRIEFRNLVAGASLPLDVVASRHACEAAGVLCQWALNQRRLCLALYDVRSDSLYRESCSLFGVSDRNVWLRNLALNDTPLAQRERESSRVDSSVLDDAIETAENVVSELRRNRATLSDEITSIELSTRHIGRILSKHEEIAMGSSVDNRNFDSRSSKGSSFPGAQEALSPGSHAKFLIFGSIPERASKSRCDIGAIEANALTAPPSEILTFEGDGKNGSLLYTQPGAENEAGRVPAVRDSSPPNKQCASRNRKQQNSNPRSGQSLRLPSVDKVPTGNSLCGGQDPKSLAVSSSLPHPRSKTRAGLSTGGIKSPHPPSRRNSAGQWLYAARARSLNRATKGPVASMNTERVNFSASENTNGSSSSKKEASHKSIHSPLRRKSEPCVASLEGVVQTNSVTVCEVIEKFATGKGEKLRAVVSTGSKLKITSPSCTKKPELINRSYSITNGSSSLTAYKPSGILPELRKSAVGFAQSSPELHHGKGCKGFSFNERSRRHDIGIRGAISVCKAVYHGTARTEILSMEKGRECSFMAGAGVIESVEVKAKKCVGGDSTEGSRIKELRVTSSVISQGRGVAQVLAVEAVAASGVVGGSEAAASVNTAIPGGGVAEVLAAEVLGSGMVVADMAIPCEGGAEVLATEAEGSGMLVSDTAIPVRGLAAVFAAELVCNGITGVGTASPGESVSKVFAAKAITVDSVAGVDTPIPGGGAAEVLGAELVDSGMVVADTAIPVRGVAAVFAAEAVTAACVAGSDSAIPGGVAAEVLGAEVVDNRIAGSDTASPGEGVSKVLTADTVAAACVAGEDTVAPGVDAAVIIATEVVAAFGVVGVCEAVSSASLGGVAAQELVAEVVAVDGVFRGSNTAGVDTISSDGGTPQYLAAEMVAAAGTAGSCGTVGAIAVTCGGAVQVLESISDADAVETRLSLGDTQHENDRQASIETSRALGRGFYYDSSPHSSERSGGALPRLGTTDIILRPAFFKRSTIATPSKAPKTRNHILGKIKIPFPKFNSPRRVDPSL